MSERAAGAQISPSGPDPRMPGRHRRPARSVLPLLTTGSMLLAVLVLGSAILMVKPDQERFQRPFVRSAEMGEPASARTFDVTVLDVTGAKKIQSGAVLETSGIWVAVSVRVVAGKEPSLIGYAALRDERGRVFLYSDRLNQPLAGGRALQPGVPLEGQVFFEVTKGVKELTVRFARPVSYGLDMEALVEVRLPVTQAKVTSWAVDEKPLELFKPKVVA